MKLKNVPPQIEGLTPWMARFVAAYMSTFKVTMAAERVGISPEEGFALLRNPVVQRAIDQSYARLYEEAMIDGAWLLEQMVENHFIARQCGNLSASNQALTLIAKHSAVDAFSPERLEIAGDKERVERLLRGRERAAASRKQPQAPPNNDDVSFV
jgi:hypothetical protein